MVPKRSDNEARLIQTVQRLGKIGIQRVPLFSGHFADERLQMFDEMEQVWNAKVRAPLVKALTITRDNVPNVPPDHADLFETTYRMRSNAAV